MYGLWVEQRSVTCISLAVRAGNSKIFSSVIKRSMIHVFAQHL